MLTAVLAASAMQCVVAQTGFATDEFGSDLSRAPSGEEAARVRGPTIIDLPMHFRAQLNAAYTRSLYRSDALAKSHIDQYGPELRGNHSLQSHVELTRFLSDGIEVGIVWGGRSRISETSVLDFGRQTVGAMIRFIP